jgi:hypothetical protein
MLGNTAPNRELAPIYGLLGITDYYLRQPIMPIGRIYVTHSNCKRMRR